MIVRKIILASAIGLCLMNNQAIAKDPVQPEVSGAKTDEVESLHGVINYVDHTKGRIVISDMAYSFSPLKLVVHNGDRISGVISLRSNQTVRYICLPSKPGSSLAAGRTITEIWIEKN